MNDRLEAWLGRECKRLDAVLGIHITRGIVRLAPVPLTDGEYAVIIGVDFEAEKDGHEFSFATEGNFWTPLRVVKAEENRSPVCDAALAGQR